MASKMDEPSVGYIEAVDGGAARRGSAVSIPEHSVKPVWEQRQTYGPPGIRGIFKSRYVFAAAAFATLGGTLFGYE